MALKPEVRIIGWDDAPFERADQLVPLVGVVTRAATGYVECVLRTQATVDGDDATQAIASATQQARIRPNLVGILVQNLMVGGFNTLDLEQLHGATGLPVIAVARGQPDLAAVRSALVGTHIPNGEDKWARIRRVAPSMIGDAEGKLTLTPVGLDGAEARELVAQATLRGFMPEPLRLAHMIAAGWVLGESRGQ